MSYKDFSRPPKSSGERLKESISFMFAATIILSLFNWVFELIMKPLRDPILGPEDFKARAKKVAVDKVMARDEYYEKIASDESDPMHQFQLRYLTNVDNYKRDKDNAQYKAWFEAWKAGLVLDSGLRWAPEISVNKDGNYNPYFIKYAKIQLDLHKSKGLINRIIFCRTINRYYPELTWHQACTPDLRKLDRDISLLYTKAEEGALKEEIKETIKEYGLSEDLADYLVESDAKDIKTQAEKLKDFSNHGLRPKTCICALEQNLTLDEARVVNEIVTEFDLPVKVGLAFLRKEITAENLSALVRDMNSVCNQYGNDIFTCREGEDITLYEELLEECLKRYKGQKRLAKFN